MIVKTDGSMLIEEPKMRESLRKIISRFSSDPVLLQDMMQESLVHLWRIEREKPGRTRSWYLQNCRFHLQHWLAAGRSVDSPKRTNGDKRIPIDGMNHETVLQDYHTNGDLFDSVCARDMVNVLALYLKPHEQAVLGGLADGLILREIASKFTLSYPTALKYRRKIAGLTAKLGMATRSVSSEEGDRPVRIKVEPGLDEPTTSRVKGQRRKREGRSPSPSNIIHLAISIESDDGFRQASNL
jgi:DNA-binding CsgD family transcriptional regulator